MMVGGLGIGEVGRVVDWCVGVEEVIWNWAKRDGGDGGVLVRRAVRSSADLQGGGGRGLRPTKSSTR